MSMDDMDIYLPALLNRSRIAINNILRCQVSILHRGKASVLSASEAYFFNEISVPDEEQALSQSKRAVERLSHNKDLSLFLFGGKIAFFKIFDLS